MLVDIVAPERLPFVILWLDWNLQTYWPSLLVALGVAILGWLGYCLWRYGYAVG